MTSFRPFGADGYDVRWTRCDGRGVEDTTIRWENEGFTVVGSVSAENVQYVLRLSASWQVRQFMLFRDLDEPDLWLATDGSGRWGEMNGARRTELDGCHDVHLSCTPFTNTLPIRRLPVAVGDMSVYPVVTIDVDTLDVRTAIHTYTHVGPGDWLFDGGHDQPPVRLLVDDYGLVLDYPSLFTRDDSSARA
jgi:hypothetical protein